MDPEEIWKTLPIMKHFSDEGLTPHQYDVVEPIDNLARELVEILPECPERAIMLRRLLEARDAALRAMLG